jgi:hypothetical protein
MWMSNLFGRVTFTLVLPEQLREAYEAADYQRKLVARTQRSLLPPRIPKIPTLALAAHHQTSQRAGGDDCDSFLLPGGKRRRLIAGVSGHGVHAVIYMAATGSDQYALAVIFFWPRTGRWPSYAPSRPAHPGPLLEGVSEAEEPVLRRAIDLEPARRFGSCG